MPHPDWQTLTVFEEGFWRQGLVVAGTDEVGRGPLAGPVVAAAVVLSRGAMIAGLDDSKRLTEMERQRLFYEVWHQAEAIGIGAVGPQTIDRLNILEASRLAMQRALAHLPVIPEVVLADAMRLTEGPYYTVSLIKGDQRSASIAAASVIAKVLRDRYMVELHREFPEYGFDRHKGYPTKAHRDALDARGPSAAHRLTFLRRRGVSVRGDGQAVPGAAHGFD
ncbi:MAG: ribonuclease HII [Firmicutes bacterium]|nr:ribonuclease HII [Bacillota bacterium]